MFPWERAGIPRQLSPCEFANGEGGAGITTPGTLHHAGSLSLFVPGVASVATRPTARRLDLFDQRRQLLRVAPHYAGDVALVITRYYGGTNLGTGGLVSAYGTAAKLAMAALETEEKIERTNFTLAIPYALHRSVEKNLLLQKDKGFR